MEDRDHQEGTDWWIEVDVENQECGESRVWMDI